MSEEPTLETQSLVKTHLTLETVRLEVVEGDAAGQRSELHGGTMVVGTSSKADFMLRDATVSGRHASLELLAGAVRVRDLASRNGTFFLGARVETVVVPIGSRITLGRSVVSLMPVAELHQSSATRWHGLIADSAAMRSLLWRLERLAINDVTAVIRGPSGVGKELVARTLHAGGPRAKAPLEVFDAASVNAELLESELFGHVKGAFTGAHEERVGLLERVDRGTLVLDNVDHLAPALQPRLLRFLEARTVRRVGGGEPRSVDVRVLATAQQPLEAAVAQGRLRPDLYYRLAGIVLDVPPLQQRRDDIPALCALFLDEAGARVALTPATLAALQAHPWPGQVRELRHAVQRAVAFGRFEQTAEAKASAGEHGLLEARARVSQAFEADVVRALLERHGWNVAAVAREARIARSHLYTLITRHGLTRPR